MTKDGLWTIGATLGASRALIDHSDDFRALGTERTNLALEIAEEMARHRAIEGGYDPAIQRSDVEAGIEEARIAVL